VIDKLTGMFHIKIKYVVTDSTVVSVLEISNVFLAVCTFRCRWLCPSDGDTSNSVVVSLEVLLGEFVTAGTVTIFYKNNQTCRRKGLKNSVPKGFEFHPDSKDN